MTIHSHSTNLEESNDLEVAGKCLDYAIRDHSLPLRMLARRQIDKQRLLVPYNVRSLIEPGLRSAV